MRSFKDFLLEYDMSTQDAMNILGIESFETAKDLQQAYKKASMKAHPDLGGTDDEMKKVNVAYDILKKKGAAKDDRASRDRQREENDTKRWTIQKAVMEHIRKNFDVQAYIDHFKKFIKKEFTGKIETITVDKTYYSNVGNTSLKASFASDDNETIITMDISLYQHSIDVHNPALSVDSMDMNVTIIINILHDLKKHKVAPRDYLWSKSSKQILHDPSYLFPEKGMARILKNQDKKKVTRKDFDLTLKTKFGASVIPSSSKSIAYYFINVGDSYNIGITRSVMMRTAMWSIEGLYRKHHGYTMIYSVRPRVYAAENFETLQYLVDNIPSVSSAITEDDKKIAVENLAAGFDKISKE